MYICKSIQLYIFSNKKKIKDIGTIYNELTIKHTKKGIFC